MERAVLHRRDRRMGRYRLTLGLVSTALLAASCSQPAPAPDGATASASVPSSASSSTPPGTASTVPSGTSPAPPVPELEIDPTKRAKVQTLNCRPAIDEVASVEEVSNDPLATDVMALAGGGPGQPDQPVKWYDGVVYHRMHFIKVGLAVHRGAEFTIEVPPSWQDRMRIGWGNEGYTFANTLKVPGCVPESDGAQWLVFPGGFWLAEPDCVPLKIQTAGRTRTIHVPIGERCP